MGEDLDRSLATRLGTLSGVHLHVSGSKNQPVLLINIDHKKEGKQTPDTIRFGFDSDGLPTVAVRGRRRLAGLGDLELVHSLLHRKALLRTMQGEE